MAAWYSITEWGLLILVLLGAVVGLGIFIWNITRYKHKFRIKMVTGTKTIVLDDRAKIFNDKDGVTWMKLMKRKHIIQVPPADCMDVTERGKFSVEAYYSEEGWYQYEKSAGTEKDLPGKLKDKGGEWQRKEMRMVLWGFWRWKIWTRTVKGPARFVFIKDKAPDVTGTDVLTTKQKIIMVNQIEKAKARKGFNWRDHIPTIVGATAVVMLVLCIMVFWGEFAQPMKDAAVEFRGIQSEQRMTQEEMSKTAGMMVSLVNKLTAGDPSLQTTQDRVLLDNRTVPR